MKLRTPLAKFSREMERVLRKNDHKPGWDNESPFLLLNRLVGEVFELNVAMDHEIYHIGAPPKGLSFNQAVVKEAVDVANFAMMIADKYRDEELT